MAWKVILLVALDCKTHEVRSTTTGCCALSYAVRVGCSDADLAQTVPDATRLDLQSDLGFS